MLKKENIKLIAFDLDGTLTQHRTNITQENRKVLDALGKRYKLVMASAGMCRRVYNQMGQYPIDVVGNYGLQEARYDHTLGDLVITRDTVLPCNRDSVEARMALLREKHGYTEFAGNSVEFHSSGCISLPLLGTAAQINKKLVFDPKREKRLRIYEDVKQVFSEYTVFLSGSSSFDLVPPPYDKYYALDRYCQQQGISHEQVVYVGDDYGVGGNDESVYLSDIFFLPIKDYRTFPQVMQVLL